MAVLIITVVIFMARDMLNTKVQEKNPYAYDLNNFKGPDSTKICFGEINRINPEIESLKGIAVDTKDNIYLVGEKLVVYNTKLEKRKEFALAEKAQNIEIAESGELYLGVKDHIEVWDSEGNRKANWKAFNEKSVITSLALKGESLFVADAGNKLVLKYNLKGELQKEIGRKDSIKNKLGFIIPSPYFDIAIGRQGELWAVNSGLHQFEAYNEQGEQFSKWDRTSMQWEGFSGCCNPSHMALMSDGSFVTSEKGLVRIKIHSPNGDFKCIVASPKEFDEDARGLDLAVDSQDRIYTIVPQNNELRVYAKK